MFISSHINYFSECYLDYSSSSIKNLFFASLVSKNTFAYRKGKIFLPKVKYIKPEIGIHAAVLHAKMIDSSTNEKEFNLDLLKLEVKNTASSHLNKTIKSNSKIISVQVSSANFNAKYKNWPVQYWIELLDKIIKIYPEYTIVLLGDKNEITIEKEIISKIKSKRLISFIGKTTLVDVSAILYNSDIYIGLDSGFMHLAVAYGIPTFTILGGSSEDFIGYHKFDKKHFVIHSDLSCRSCHAWIGANASRVNNPNNCPDIKCLIDLLPEIVFEKFELFVNNIKLCPE
jgi:ADP-heptose:LPS heptosyltransferase